MSAPTELVASGVIAAHAHQSPWCLLSTKSARDFYTATGLRHVDPDSDCCAFSRCICLGRLPFVCGVASSEYQPQTTVPRENASALMACSGVVVANLFLFSRFPIEISICCRPASSFYYLR